jgi:hypothetical protein
MSLLERNSGSEIPTELNKIYTSLKEYIFKIERQEALKVSSDEQYDKVQSLEVDKKIEELEKMYDQFLELSRENSSMGEWAETYKSFVERDIEVTKESQGELEKWDQPVVSMDSTDPFVGYEHQVIVTIENDPILLKNGERLVAKYPHNTTIVHSQNCKELN